MHTKSLFLKTKNTYENDILNEKKIVSYIYNFKKNFKLSKY